MSRYILYHAFKFNQPFLPLEMAFCTPFFCGFGVADCEATFCYFEKSERRQAWGTSVRSLVHLGQEKVSVAPDMHDWDQNGLRPSVRFRRTGDRHSVARGEYGL